MQARALVTQLSKPWLLLFICKCRPEGKSKYPKYSQCIFVKEKEKKKSV